MNGIYGKIPEWKWEKVFIWIGKKYPWIKIITKNEDGNKGKNYNIHRFFDYVVNPGTIDIRLDNEIIWVEDYFVKNLKKFREVDHIHFFGYYIGNYPSIRRDKIIKICKILNSITHE